MDSTQAFVFNIMFYMGVLFMPCPINWVFLVAQIGFLVAQIKLIMAGR